MTDWYTLNVDETTVAGDHYELSIVDGIPAGRTLCAIEGSVLTSVAVNEITSSTTPAFLNGWGGGIGAVPAGNTMPSYNSGIADDIWIQRRPAGSLDAHFAWPSSSTSGYLATGDLVRFFWRGARYYAASMDWYICLSVEGPYVTSRSATGAVRLGFWD